MPLQSQRHIGRRHAATIVAHLNQINAAGTKTDCNIARPGIDGIFNQFLQRTGRSFYHFTGSDAVDQIFRKSSY